jgi:hypothetical protein
MPQPLADDEDAAGWLTAPALYRPAAPAELRAVRMLLPDLTIASERFVAAVAVAGTPERVVGAAAVSLDDADPEEPRGGGPRPFQIAMVAPRQGQGIEAPLLACLATLAPADMQAVVTIDWLDPAAPTAMALAAAGFAESRRRDEYEGAFADVARALGPLLTEARDRGLVAPDARVVPLADADLAPVAQLHVSHFGGDVERALRMLGGAPPWRYDPRISFVVLQGEQALGYTLGRLAPPDRRVCQFDYTAIDPRHRGGWPNLLLRAHATDALLRAGVEVYRYCATDRHADSRRAARRIKARLLRTTVRLAKSTGGA